MTDSHEASYSYSVKIVSTAKKSDFTVMKLHRSFGTKFTSLDEIKEEIIGQCHLSNITQLGYIEPGHGIKGKQQWLTSDTDLKEMYDCFKRGKKEIILWCYTGESTVAKTPVKK